MEKKLKDNREEPGSGSLTPHERMEQYLLANYCFRINVVTGRIEMKTHSKQEFTYMNDMAFNSLHRELVKAGIKVSLTGMRNTLLSNFTPTFNPFLNYLAESPPWDGKDYIAELADTVKTTNQELWVKSFRKWFVALVGSLLEDHVVNHTLIVFSGAQGIGKTTWMLNLIPEELKEYAFSGMINPGNKDTIIQLSECMLVNLDELESLNKTDVSILKEIITKSQIRVRRPYGHSSELLPRRASFAGSVNGKEFLNDVTGSRRFLCFEVSDIQYHHDIELSRVYAQAVHLFKSGFKYWFDQSEIREVQENNDQYRSLSVEEELLLKYYERCSKAEATCFVSATDLVNMLREKANVSINDSARDKIGKALRAHDFLRIKLGQRYVYAIKEKALSTRSTFFDHH